MYAWDHSYCSLYALTPVIIFKRSSSIKKALAVQPWTAEVPCCVKYLVQQGKETTSLKCIHFKGQTMYTIKSVVIYLNIYSILERKEGLQNTEIN